MVAPLTETICRTVAQPCPPQTCPTGGASIATDASFVLPTGIETPVDFDIDVFETGPVDADSMNEQIVVTEDLTALVQYNASYGPGSPGSTVTVRILVDGISNPELTFVHPLGAAPTTQVEEVAVELSAVQALTVTLETDIVGEGVLVNFVSLTALSSCGPFTDVVVPQG